MTYNVTAGLSLLLLLLWGCSVFDGNTRPCESERYSCPTLDPSADLAPAADLATVACTLEAPCVLSRVESRAPVGLSRNLRAQTQLVGGEVFVAADSFGSGTSQGSLLRVPQSGVAVEVSALPIATPRSVTVTSLAPVRLLLTGPGASIYTLEPSLGGAWQEQRLDAGSCLGRVSAAGQVYHSAALSGSDWWLVGSPTSDAAAGLLRVDAGRGCQVLSEPQSAGLSFFGAWGTTLAGAEPAERVVWTVGESAAAVRWTFQGPQGAPQLQRFSIGDGAVTLRAVSGGPQGAVAYVVGSRGTLVKVEATGAPQTIAVPTALQTAELLDVAVTTDEVWLIGTQGAGASGSVLARYQPQLQAWSLWQTPALLRSVSSFAPGTALVAGDQGLLQLVSADAK